MRKDTIRAVATVEEDYMEANPVQTFKNRFFRFYFDSTMRVTAVGISNYGNVLIDTTTCFPIRVLYMCDSRSSGRIPIRILRQR
jgi:hypothetical protein